MTQMTLNETLQIGRRHHQTGRWAEAEKIYHQVLAQQPNHPEALHLLGMLAGQRGQLNTAVELIGRTVQLRPDYAEAHNNLANALRDMGQLDDAVASYQRAIRFKPDLAGAYNNLANALKDMGQIDQAIAAYREAVRLKPDYAEAHGNILLALHYSPAFDPRSLLLESGQWNRRHAEPRERFIQPHANDRDPDRRLRLGYVSPDFRDHPVSRFVLPLLAAHDHTAFDIFAYSVVSAHDKITTKLKACCDTWRSTVGLSDEQAAEMIRQDRIDILIDLAGHTAENRLPIFAHKPAPVQVTWLGYPGTTGLATMDYRLTDALADPPGVTDEFCTERLIRLPRTNWCFGPPDDAPAVNELPAIANHRVTFGSFNNLAKVNEPMLTLWAKILHAVPGSKLLLKAKPLRCASVQQRLRNTMTEAGIEPDRLEMIGWAPSAVYLATYNRLDIALDTYPYHGTTTTCESLWMGVPVVTLSGESHVSRVGVSLLSNAGLPQLIALTPEQYAQIAVDLANDLPRLSELHHTLRRRMAASPLMDRQAFARDMETVYRAIWRDWCARK